MIMLLLLCGLVLLAFTILMVLICFRHARQQVINTTVGFTAENTIYLNGLMRDLDDEDSSGDEDECPLIFEVTARADAFSPCRPQSPNERPPSPEVRVECIIDETVPDDHDFDDRHSPKMPDADRSSTIDVPGTDDFAPLPVVARSPEISINFEPEEDFNAAVQKSVTRNIELLREPFKTNTDILPQDDWYHTTQLLTYSEFTLNMAPIILDMLKNMQVSHQRDLEAQLDVLTKTSEYTDLAKYEHTIKEHRFEKMLEVICNLRNSSYSTRDLIAEKRSEAADTDDSLHK